MTTSALRFTARIHRGARNHQILERHSDRLEDRDVGWRTSHLLAPHRFLEVGLDMLADRSPPPRSRAAGPRPRRSPPRASPRPRRPRAMAALSSSRGHGRVRADRVDVHAVGEPGAVEQGHRARRARADDVGLSHVVARSRFGRPPRARAPSRGRASATRRPHRRTARDRAHGLEMGTRLHPGAEDRRDGRRRGRPGVASPARHRRGAERGQRGAVDDRLGRPASPASNST